MGFYTTLLSRVSCLRLSIIGDYLHTCYTMILSELSKFSNINAENSS